MKLLDCCFFFPGILKSLLSEVLASCEAMRVDAENCVKPAVCVLGQQGGAGHLLPSEEYGEDERRQ